MKSIGANRLRGPISPGASDVQGQCLFPRARPGFSSSLQQTTAAPLLNSGSACRCSPNGGHVLARVTTSQLPFDVANSRSSNHARFRLTFHN